ncbi:MAG: ATP-binding protein [Pirellulales bacterium]|nr:ATP-binding protein [Pirellulales bacterium]
METQENKPGENCRDSLLADQVASLEVVVNGLEQRLDDLEGENSSIRADIHDGFLQDAQAALMFLRSPGSTEGTIARAAAALETAILKARQLLGQQEHDVHRSLDFMSLVSAIQSEALIESVAVQGTVMGSAASVSEEFHEPLWRILYEAIRNVAKHSGTLVAEVTLEFREDILQAEVRDRGSGFDMDSVPGDRFGISSMMARAAQMGGQLWIETDRGMGTSVRLRVPMKQGV